MRFFSTVMTMIVDDCATNKNAHKNCDNEKSATPAIGVTMFQKFI